MKRSTLLEVFHFKIDSFKVTSMHPYKCQKVNYVCVQDPKFTEDGIARMTFGSYLANYRKKQA